MKSIALFIEHAFHNKLIPPDAAMPAPIAHGRYLLGAPGRTWAHLGVCGALRNAQSVCHTACDVFPHTSGQQVKTSMGPLIGAVSVLAAVAGILSWLRFSPNGPQLVASIKARIDAPRREREELRRQVAQMAEQLQALQARVADLEVSEAEWLKGMPFDRSPIAQRIKQAAKEHAKGLTAPHTGGAPVGR